MCDRPRKQSRVRGPGAQTGDVAPAALRRRLDDGLAELAVGRHAKLDVAARDRLIALLLLLARWNRTYNLTAVRDPSDMVPRHLLDSLAVLPWIDHGPVLDAGTGAGLPGLPLAVARPDLRFTLLDSNGKKTRFVRQAVHALGLKNVEVVHARLEAYRPGPKFVTITARAVASLSELTRACAHLAATDARLLALKGRLPEREIAALAHSATGIAAPLTVHALRIPRLDAERHLIEISLHAHAQG